MKLVMVHPQNYLHDNRTGLYSKLMRYMPITMPTLAALIPQEIKADVRIYDEIVEITDTNCEADLVAITALAGTSKRAYEIADAFRNRGIPVVMGGVHTTLMPDEAAQHADAIVTGFAEETWPQLLRDFTKGKMKKRYKQSKKFELKNIPIPRRELLKSSEYAANKTLEISRGCPNDCEFCIFRGLKLDEYYTKPIDEAINEIKKLKSKNVLFLDANVIGDKEYAKQLFEKMIPLKKWWVGCVAMDVVNDDELFNLMVKSGCKGVLMGFESLCDETISRIDKKQNIGKDYNQVIKKLHDHGIAVQGTFVFGFDSDTLDTFQTVFDFVNQSGIDFPQYTLNTPFPGTPHFKKLDEQGRILTYDWSFYNGQNCVFEPVNMTARELEKNFQKIQKMTYGFRSVAKRVRKSPNMLKPLMLSTNIFYGRYARKIPVIHDSMKNY